MGDLLNAIKLTNLVEGVDGGGETTVEAEDLVLDNGGEGEVIEELGEDLPHVGIAVFAETFIVETIPIT